MTETIVFEGVIATQSSISSIIDDQLTYVGYKIDDLAENSSFEEVVFLLWNQKLPTQAELEDLKQKLADNMDIPDAIIDHLQTYNLTKIHPIVVLNKSDYHFVMIVYILDVMVSAVTII